MGVFIIAWARISFLIALACAGSTHAFAADAETTDVEVLERGTYAVPIDRTHPKYPNKAASKWIEGYVVLSFVVQEDGTVGEIKVLDAVPKGYFENPARRSVQKWIYEPATQDGKPIVQAKTKVLLSFQLGGRPIGASGRFIKHYKRAFKALEVDDLDLAMLELDEIEKKELKGLYEVYYLHLLKAHIKIAEDNSREAIWYLIRATRSSNGAIEEATYLKALGLLYALQIEDSQLVEALSTYEKLVESESLEANDPIHKHAQEVRTALDSMKPLVVAGKLDEACSECEKPDLLQWTYTLYRDAFTFETISGRIDWFELYCGYHWAKIKFEPELAWKLSENWGKCDLYVYGKSGTIFRLIEEWQTANHNSN